MCVLAVCKMNDFVLRGAVLAVPESGWKILVLPESAQHLSGIWATHPYRPKNAKAAWQSMIDFLAANEMASTALTNEIKMISVEQWCSPQPRLCQGFRSGAPKAILPWAREAWESANRALYNGLSDEAARTALADIVSNLTTLINGPDGCIVCASHWSVALMNNPLPASLTLHQARHWLVDIHNETREGKSPVPFATVAAKFNWTLPT